MKPFRSRKFNINQAGIYLVWNIPTGFLPAEILASLTRVIIEATVGTAPEVPLSIEMVPLSMSKNALLKQLSGYTLEFWAARLPHALALISGYARYHKKRGYQA